MHYLRYYNGFPYVDKITDIFAAAESSSFFGAMYQKIGAQQEKVSMYLATIGKMVKEMFQLVRELRILDERLSYYVDSYSNSKSRESAEITLKGIWVDMVEQGAKNPASVYGMSREVMFTTLPDLFFSTHPHKQEDVDVVVDETRGQFNRKVREVLKRKLRAFLAWKEHTFEELKNRRIFTLKYLRQHYEIIKMYMQWVKPYLKNLQRMRMDQNKVDSPDLLVAFESSMIEVEILARKPIEVELSHHKSTVSEVVLVHFLFRTRPEMNYSQEYQRGPLHLGRIQMNFRAYAWNDDEIAAYKNMRDQEDFQLIGLIDASVKAAMEALGDELMRYLRESGEDFAGNKAENKDDNSHAINHSLFSPFTSIFSGFSKLLPSFSSKGHGGSHGKLNGTDSLKLSMGKVDVANGAKTKMWKTYHHFKKHHGMLNWN